MARIVLAGLIGLLLLANVAHGAGEEDVFEWQPEIHHIFRQPERMPATWLSNAFTLITLSPWLILLLGWLQIGVTPVKVTRELVNGSTMRTLSILSFVGSLAAVEYVFYLYWTRLNIFETLKCLAVVGLVAFATGQRALTQIQDRRQGIE